MVQIVCPNCNFSKDIDRERIPPGVRFATCPKCRRRFELILGESLPGEGASKGDTGEDNRSSWKIAPWEKRFETGTWKALLGTFKEVLLSPETFFSNMNCSMGIKEPLAFGLLFGSLGSMLGVFWQFLTGWGGLASLVQSAVGRIGIVLLFVVIAMVLPLFTLITMLVASGIMHLCLRILKAGNRRFEGTFRVVAYSQAAQILGFFPFVGGFIGGLWQLIVQIIGLREIHDTSYLKVFLSLFLGLIMVVLFFFLSAVPFFLLL